MVRYTSPEMFYLFIPLLLLIIWHVYHGKRLSSYLDRIGAKEVKRFMVNRFKFTNIYLRSRLIILALIFILFASTGPQIGMKLTELKRKGIDILILMDTSTSMNAVDVRPSRIEKAKYELGQFVSKLKGDRIGLIAFAGSAHLHCPLTLDYSALKLFLNMMDANLISSQGTDLAAAIKLALKHIKDDDEKYKVIILISDGEDHQGEAINIAEQAKDLGIIIHTLGVGTVAGGPIPIYDVDGNRQEFKRDNNGEIVTSTLNQHILNEIATNTGGIYLRIANQSNAILPLLNEIEKMDKREIKSHVFSQYEERYQIFLIIALLLFCIEFLIPTRTNKEIAWEGRFSKTR